MSLGFVDEAALKTALNDDGDDPAAAIKGMPPNFGEFPVPHVATFMGIVNAASKVYSRLWDEAMRNSEQNSRFMLNDCRLTECLDQRFRSTALLNWHIAPDDPTDQEQVALAEDMTKIIGATPKFMQYRESLLWAIWYGRAAVQQRFRWKEVKRGQSLRLCVHDWKPINGDKLAFQFANETGMYDEDRIGVRVGAGLSVQGLMKWDPTADKRIQGTDWGMAYFPPKHQRINFVVHKHQIIDGEWDDAYTAGRIHGVGVRSRIYWNWFQMTNILGWLLEYLERSAFGTEIWYYPYGNTEAKDLTMKAAQERIGGGRNIILVPRPVDEGNGNAYGVERIENGMQGVDQLKNILVDFFSHSIKRYILGQTLTSEADTGGVGSDLAGVHLNTFMQIVKYDCVNLQETLERELLRPLQAINFPSLKNLPLHFVIDTESADVESKLQAWQTAWQMGLALKGEDIYEMIGATMPRMHDTVLVNPQIQQAQMQIQQMQQQIEMQQMQMQQGILPGAEQGGQAAGGAGGEEAAGGGEEGGEGGAEGEEAMAGAGAGGGEQGPFSWAQ